MQDPIQSLTPTMTVGTIEAHATLELVVEEILEDEGRPEV
jgi:ABC-type dipeptide/oligopeptide/nickel transport system ATPase component